MGVLWVFYGCFMGVLWVFYGCFMGVLRPLYGCFGGSSLGLTPFGGFLTQQGEYPRYVLALTQE